MWPVAQKSRHQQYTRWGASNEQGSLFKRSGAHQEQAPGHFRPGMASCVRRAMECRGNLRGAAATRHQLTCKCLRLPRATMAGAGTILLDRLQSDATRPFSRSAHDTFSPASIPTAPVRVRSGAWCSAFAACWPPGRAPSAPASQVPTGRQGRGGYPLPALPAVFETYQHKVRVSIVARGLDRPWSLLMLPDGDMLVSMRYSNQIRAIRKGVLDPDAADRAAADAAHVRHRAPSEVRREQVDLLRVFEGGQRE